MSETPGSRPDEASSGARGGEEQPSPEQPYDVPSSAQQYGQPPATGYQPPAADGQSAPVQGHGPQQYGQPEHGQASYAQEGFPAPGSGPGGYEPTEPGYGQPPVTGAPSYGPPGQGYAPQTPPYEQQPPYGGQQPYGQQGYPGQQPYGGQPPYAPGYPPQPYTGQQPMSDGDQRLWATLSHISIPFFGFVGPLVAYLLLKDRGTFIQESTTEALNFSILFSIAITVSSFLTALVIGAILLPIVWIGAIIFCIIAAIASNKGDLYRYPLNWRLVK
jgi:uncharacterized Tic20 family protein